LVLHILDDDAELANADASEVVPLGPPKWCTSQEAIPIREPGTRSLQTLDKSGDVDDRRQTQHQVHVIRQDSGRQNSRAVPFGLTAEEAM
jgi:hypothetical protein